MNGLAEPSSEYRLQLERVLVRVLMAVARRHKRSDDLPSLKNRMETAEKTLGDVPFSERRGAQLAEQLRLPAEVMDFVWTAISLAADPRVAAHAEALAGPHARRGLSLGLQHELWLGAEDRALEVSQWLLGGNPLLDNHLLRVAEDGMTPASRAYSVPSRLAAHLAGDDRLESPLRRVAAEESCLFDAEQAQSLNVLAQAMQQRTAVVAVVEGARGTGRRTAVARSVKDSIITLDASKLSSQGFITGLQTLRRETAISGAVPMIVDIDDVITDAEARHALAKFVATHHGPLAVATTGWGIDLGGEAPVIRVRWNLPNVDVRRALWERTLDDPSIDSRTLALRFQVGPLAVQRAATSARATLNGALTTDALIAGIRHNIAERLGGLATRVEVRQSWDDAVLGDETRDQVRALIARIRHAHRVLEDWQYRGKLALGHGVPALFSGPPGTGKTMVAGIIARELGLDLYQVDLSQVVSKWIGETEKHLGRLFDAAQEGHALLLFDEADALFGARTTDVKGAVDRYANLEVNYLLQRVESFGGITILTTNLESGIDRALKRRLAAHIVFETPDEEERAKLWARLTSTTHAPLASDLDVDALARAFPNMTGANIRNAALSAAYLAADEGATTITQDHLVRAARVEYRGMGHILSDRGGSTAARKPYQG